MGTSFSFPFSSPFGDGSSPVPPTPGPVPLLDLPPGLSTRSSSPFVINGARVIVMVPTAINTCLAAAENITENLRVRQPASLTLPSLYKRAYLIAYETDEIALVRK